MATRRESLLCCANNPLGLERFLLRKQPGGESLPFTDAVDLDCGGFDDLLDACYSRQELGIPARVERLSLTSTLSKEIGTRKGARENTNAREESDERDKHSEITGSHLDLL